MLRLARACLGQGWAHGRCGAVPSFKLHTSALGRFNGMARAKDLHVPHSRASASFLTSEFSAKSRDSGARSYCATPQHTRTVRITRSGEEVEVQVPSTCSGDDLVALVSDLWNLEPSTVSLQHEEFGHVINRQVQGVPLVPAHEDDTPHTFHLLSGMEVQRQTDRDPTERFESELWSFCSEQTHVPRIIERLAVAAELDGVDVDEENHQGFAKHLYPALFTFSRRGMQVLSEDTRKAVRDGTITDDDLRAALLDAFVAYFTSSLPNKHKALLEAMESGFLGNSKRLDRTAALDLADMSNPHMWYPLCRQERRKVSCETLTLAQIILHVGPTNSGKTHRALEALKAAESGMYLGPLRLLAQEVYDRLNKEGVPTSLLTGQQKREVEGARHSSCTVEMAETSKRVECAVLDEIQMMADPDRGWAWTRALLGVPALTLHVCGSPSAVPLVEKICQQSGDDLEVEYYERLSPLEQTDDPLESVYDIEKGDCIVGFSRRDLYDIKYQVEREMGLRCCLVYGGLPPETRAMQAALFNDPDSSYDVLVASDAVGMGLNLNIRRVLFSTTSKYDGTSQRTLVPSEVKQIAGRAGRFHSQFPEGYVSTFSRKDHSVVRRSLRMDDLPIAYAGLHPAFEQIEMFALTQRGKYFSKILERFAKLAELDNDFFLCNFETLVELAAMTDDLPLTLAERYTFCTAPVDTNSPTARLWFRKYAEGYAKVATRDPLPCGSGSVDLGVPVGISCDRTEGASRGSVSKEQLKSLETVHHVLDFYLWLSYRFRTVFTHGAAAEREREKCYTVIERSLEDLATHGMSGFAGKSKKRRRRRRPTYQ